MLQFAYSLFLKLIYPTSLCMILLIASVILRRWKRTSLACLLTGLGILLIGGNGWLIGALTRDLEWRYLPPNPVPQADAILVLSGGIHPPLYPRPTIELGEAGDRLIYGAQLFKEGKAPRIVCTGGAWTTYRPVSEVMQEFLCSMGVPKESIMIETASGNTREHARNLYPMLREKEMNRILLVTSAMHMPRSMGVFQKLCPGIEFIPAPTDFRVTEPIPRPWYYRLYGFIPTPKHLLDFSEVAHEYLGMVYYRLRGWI